MMVSAETTARTDEESFKTTTFSSCLAEFFLRRPKKRLSCDLSIAVPESFSSPAEVKPPFQYGGRFLRKLLHKRFGRTRTGRVGKRIKGPESQIGVFQREKAAFFCTLK